MLQHLNFNYFMLIVCFYLHLFIIVFVLQFNFTLFILKTLYTPPILKLVFNTYRLYNYQNLIIIKHKCAAINQFKISAIIESLTYALLLILIITT